MQYKILSEYCNRKETYCDECDYIRTCLLLKNVFKETIPKETSIDKEHNEHYKQQKVQPFDVIEAMGDEEPFCRDNIIKYVMRYRHKGTPIQDIEKALVYLKKLHVLLKTEKENNENN